MHVRAHYVWEQPQAILHSKAYLTGTHSTPAVYPKRPSTTLPRPTRCNTRAFKPQLLCRKYTLLEHCLLQYVSISDTRAVFSEALRLTMCEISAILDSACGYLALFFLLCLRTLDETSPKAYSPFSEDQKTKMLLYILCQNAHHSSLLSPSHLSRLLFHTCLLCECAHLSSLRTHLPRHEPGSLVRLSYFRPSLFPPEHV